MTHSEMWERVVAALAGAFPNQEIIREDKTQSLVIVDRASSVTFRLARLGFSGRLPEQEEK